MLVAAEVLVLVGELRLERAELLVDHLPDHLITLHLPAPADTLFLLLVHVRSAKKNKIFERSNEGCL